MLDSEEKKPALEQEPSSVEEKAVPPSENLGPSLQSGSTAEAALEKAVLTQEMPSQPVPPAKVELKKHAAAVPASPTQPTSIHLKKEADENLPAVAMEVEIDFVLDRKRIPLAALSTLAPGEMIALSGADFKATLFLQEKAIGEGELVMVDQKPTIQVTKVFAL